MPATPNLVLLRDTTASAAASHRLDTSPQHPGPGGGDRTRTDDPLLAKQVLSQLSYTPGTVIGVSRQSQNALRQLTTDN